MSEFWNQRYSAEEFAYGTEPNLFFKEHIEKLTPGKILLPAEGEGRNAVYAARLGWDVTAFDVSVEGKRKAELLAAENSVTINYLLAGYDDIYFEPETFDCVVLVFAHIDSDKREKYHRKMISFLKPGGFLLLEVFSKKQINNNSGGPRDFRLLYSKAELETDFQHLSVLKTEEPDVELYEGQFHNGIASVIRVVGKK
jgi:SAM-dependent methyltransferase